MSISENGLSLFQKWILLQLYNTPGSAQKTTDILVNCCDTALTPDLLKSGNVDSKISDLVEKDFIIPYSPDTHALTNTGILYVRINLLKPITDITDLPDFNNIVQRLPEGPLKVILQEEYQGASTDKVTLSTRIREYAINHMAPYASFLNNSINIAKELGEPAGN